MASSKKKIDTQQSIKARVWLGFVLVLSVVMVSATAVVYSTHKSRHLLSELQNLEKNRNELQVEWGQLLLEQSSLVSQGRVEDRAVVELGMKVPAMKNVVVIQRD